eukprot:scaffold468332_cov18-Prasinocladus_malaysianus.AAC.1
MDVTSVVSSMLTSAASGEEPVVYVNGCPFVLRESARPFKNMQEYAGIDPTRIEQMERRLKVKPWAMGRPHQSFFPKQIQALLFPKPGTRTWLSTGLGEL